MKIRRETSRTNVCCPTGSNILKSFCLWCPNTVVVKLCAHFDNQDVLQTCAPDVHTQSINIIIHSYVLEDFIL